MLDSTNCGARRWWTYQRERFPVFRYGVLTAVFVCAAVSHSVRLRRAPFPVPGTLAAFGCVFLLFLQMRIADEFKDRDEDARYRGYRPVPRGVVKLRELGAIGLTAAAAQLVLVLCLDAALLPFLAVVWAYLALMTREFFVRDWLRAHPVAYLWTHMLNIPLIALFAGAFDWRADAQPPPHGLLWLPGTAFFVCLSLEIGRKIRAAADEELGVVTYSYLWGRRRAAGVWTGALLASGTCAWAAAGRIGPAAPVAAVAAVLGIAGAAVAVAFARNPAQGRGRAFERFSEVVAFVLLLCAGPAQVAAAAIRG